EEIESGVFLMDARVPISEASEGLGVHLSDREAHTVGGLVTARLRRIPQVGDNVEESGLLFIVEKASDRAALLIRIRLA
ncbi:MAG: HlyC/CorC family transporter, partial [Proteobacteria bacterium]|nr:HlyC/CorC family transporter [Pseudomonadota bacterium]